MTMKARILAAVMTISVLSCCDGHHSPAKNESAAPRTRPMTIVRVHSGKLILSGFQGAR